MTPSSILRIGKVIAVKGRFIEILVDKTKNGPHIVFDGNLIRNVSVGSYIKIGKGYELLVGKIEEEFVTEDKEQIGKNYRRPTEKINRILRVSLVGYIEKSSFKQGVKELPLIDNECFLLDSDEFDTIHQFLRPGDVAIEIGNLVNDTSRKIQVGINSLFASHIGIFGNTGSGKSYTLAAVYHQLFNRYQHQKAFQNNARFVLIDFNGEYSRSKSITQHKTVYNLSTRKSIDKIKKENRIPISEEIIINAELLSILAHATEKTQKPFIKRALDFFGKVMSGVDPDTHFKNILRKQIINILTMPQKDVAHALLDYVFSILINVGQDLRDGFWTAIEWNNKNNHFMKKGVAPSALDDDEKRATALYRSVDYYKFPDNCLEKVIHFLHIQLMHDLHTNKIVYEHISPAVHKLQSKAKDLEKVFDFHSKKNEIFREGKNLIVVNLNDTNIDIKKTLPLILSKHIYDTHKHRRETDDKMYLNIIIDEAHNILSFNSERESETWKDYRLETFEEIIKEGRKFGVFLTIASQRPSDISSTIISQLHNYLLHRLINNKDIEAVERTISYLDKVSFESLPILPTGTCIFAGLAAQLPVVIEVSSIEDDFQPNSKTIRPADFWIDDVELADS